MFILRIGLSMVLFVVILSGGILYTFNQTKIYRAGGMLEVHDPRPIQSLHFDDLLTNAAVPEPDPYQQSVEAELVSETEDLNTAFEVLGSESIVMGVEQRIQGERRERFMAPYLGAANLNGPLTPMEILSANRSIEKVRISKIFRVHYTHPDPVIAAEIANLFMKEFIDYYLRLEIDGYMKMVEDLRIRLQTIDDRIEEQTLQIVSKGKNGQATATQLRRMKDEREGLIEFRGTIYQAFNESKLRVNMANPRARIIDPAYPPYADQPYKPDVAKNLSYACFLALLAASIPQLASKFKI